MGAIEGMRARERNHTIIENGDTSVCLEGDFPSSQIPQTRRKNGKSFKSGNDLDRSGG
jgi:hypothetical protein